MSNPMWVDIVLLWCFFFLCPVVALLFGCLIGKAMFGDDDEDT